MIKRKPINKLKNIELLGACSLSIVLELQKKIKTFPVKKNNTDKKRRRGKVIANNLGLIIKSLRYIVDLSY